MSKGQNKKTGNDINVDERCICRSNITNIKIGPNISCRTDPIFPRDKSLNTSTKSLFDMKSVLEEISKE